jgi:hypothetical protein
MEAAGIEPAKHSPRAAGVECAGSTPESGAFYMSMRARKFRGMRRAVKAATPTIDRPRSHSAQSLGDLSAVQGPPYSAASM